MNLPIIAESIKTAEELKKIAALLQQGLSYNLPMLNGDVIVLMNIDMVIRTAGIDHGIKGLDDSYFKSNLSIIPGETVLEKTLNYISYLETQGEMKTFEGADYGLRNLKHVFDNVPDKVIEGKLPQINDLLKSWLSRRPTVLAA